MKNKIRLDTIRDVTEFVNIVASLPENVSVKITDNKAFAINGRSYMGVMYASAEFCQLYVESDVDIYDKIDKFIEV